MEIKTFLFFALLIGATLISCEKDDETSNSPTETQWGNNEQDDILTKVKSNVSVTSQYKNYHFYFSVRTSLKEVYPIKQIKYGIETGYNDGSSSQEYPYYQYAENNKYYNVNSSGSEFVFIACIFYGKYSDKAFYASSYLALMEKQKTENLRADEKDLLNDLKPILQSAESEAYPSLKIRFFAEIDGKRYYPVIIK